MVWIQIDIPEKLDNLLSIEKIKRKKITKSETIIEILEGVLK